MLQLMSTEDSISVTWLDFFLGAIVEIIHLTSSKMNLGEYRFCKQLNRLNFQQSNIKHFCYRSRPSL